MSDAADVIVATYVVQWLAWLLMAFVVGRLHTVYGHRYLGLIAASWLALSFVYLGGAAALLSADRGLAPWQPLRLGGSIVAAMAGYLQVALLLAGVYELSTRRTVPRRTLAWILGAAAAVGLATPWPFLLEPSASAARLLLRFGVRSLVAGTAFVIAGLALHRRGTPRTLGRRLVVVAFVLYGASQLHAFGIAVHRVLAGEVPDYVALLPFVDFVLLVMIGLGLVVWLLEAERESVAAFARRLDFLENHDTLTGLPNRALLAERLALDLVQARQDGRRVGVLAVALDGFEGVSDLLGRGVADDMRRAAAGRLRRAGRGLDTVARTGDDEFVVVLADIGGEDDARQRAAGVQEAIRPPFPAASDQPVYLTASLGIAVAPQHGEDAEELVAAAEAALHSAQRRGREQVLAFAPELAADAAVRLGMESALRQALEQERFRVHYQPIVALDGGALTGFEALVRWQDPSRGLLVPADFLGATEAMGLLPRIELWVLETACRQLRAWQGGDGAGSLYLAVNLSARSLQDRQAVTRIREILDRTGLPPHCLQVELTESAAAQQAEITRDVLLDLRDGGVRIAIDDFGTGYSSLSYLRTFPVDVVKMDRSFIRSIDSDPTEAAIVDAIIALAHGLGIAVVAEGVERPAQAEVLIRQGCDFGQGFLFGRPAAPETCSGRIGAPAASAQASSTMR